MIDAMQFIWIASILFLHPYEHQPDAITAKWTIQIPFGHFNKYPWDTVHVLYAVDPKNDISSFINIC